MNCVLGALSVQISSALCNGLTHGSLLSVGGQRRQNSVHIHTDGEVDHAAHLYVIPDVVELDIESASKLALEAERSAETARAPTARRSRTHGLNPTDEASAPPKYGYWGYEG